MSIEAMTWVFKHSPYKATDRLIHLAIADVVNDGHDNQFWMSQGRLAEKALCARATVNAAVARMVESGHLRVVESGRIKGKPNVYEMVMEGTGVSSMVTPHVTDGDTPVRNGDTHPITTNAKELKSPADPAALIYQLPTYTADEEEVWNSYPKTNNASKANTIKCYRKWISAGELHPTLLTATQNFARAMQGTDPAYIKRGPTFFGPDAHWTEYAENYTPPVPVGPPTGDLLARATIYDEFHNTGYWTMNDGIKTSAHPFGYHVTPPKNTAGNLVDVEGREYTVDHQERRHYLPMSSESTTTLPESAANVI